MSNWTFENEQFLVHLHEMAIFHHTKLASPLMAPEETLEEEEALRTALVAIADFEYLWAEFIKSLEKTFDN